MKFLFRYVLGIQAQKIAFLSFTLITVNALGPSFAATEMQIIRLSIESLKRESKGVCNLLLTTLINGFRPNRHDPEKGVTVPPMGEFNIKIPGLSQDQWEDLYPTLAKPLEQNRKIPVKLAHLKDILRFLSGGNRIGDAQLGNDDSVQPDRFALVTQIENNLISQTMASLESPIVPREAMTELQKSTGPGALIIGVTESAYIFVTLDESPLKQALGHLPLLVPEFRRQAEAMGAQLLEIHAYARVEVPSVFLGKDILVAPVFKADELKALAGAAESLREHKSPEGQSTDVRLQVGRITPEFSIVWSSRSPI